MAEIKNTFVSKLQSQDIEIQFDSWRECVGELSAFNSQGWVFRGMSNYKYPPISALERVLQSRGGEKSDWKNLESRSIGFFQERSRAFIVSPPRDDDLIGWLAIMQHYGASTRLTDWTFSPFVAVFFAYETITFNNASSEDAVLWMLDAGKCRYFLGSAYPVERDFLGIQEVNVNYPDGSEKRVKPWADVTDLDISYQENKLLRYAIENEVNWPIPLIIQRPDQRMSTQQACFVTNGRLTGAQEQTMKEQFLNPAYLTQPLDTIMPEPIEWRTYDGEYAAVKKGYGNQFRPTAADFVKKIKLPRRWRKEVFLSLAAMNITSDTIYPGLDGVGKATDAYVKSGGLSMSLKHHLGL